MQSTARNIRRRIVEVSYEKQTPHIGSSLSCVEILLASYKFKLDQQKKGNSNCKIVFSKGHAALAVYATLVELKELDPAILDHYNSSGSHLYGHVSHKASNNIELSTGSLGHGLPYAIGLCLGQTLNQEEPAPIITIMSDGECDEGTTWESALIASHHNLNNLTVIIDRNGLQSLKTTEQTLALEPLREKWIAFGWEVIEVDGHDVNKIYELLKIGEKPKCIIANTHKGNGVSFMKDSVLWHYKSPSSSEYQSAIEEIDS